MSGKPTTVWCLVYLRSRILALVWTEIQLGFNATNWANYNQGNDFSFLAQTGGFLENLNYPAYIAGKLVWGIEPAVLSGDEQSSSNMVQPMMVSGQGLEPLNIAPVPFVSLLYKSVNTNAQTNSIQHHIRLVNHGQTEIDLAELKLRYWYTNEPYKPQHAHIYWASCGQKNVTTRFASLFPSTRDADLPGIGFYKPRPVNWRGGSYRNPTGLILSMVSTIKRRL